MTQKRHGRGRVDLPLQRIENHPFHFFNVSRSKLTPAQIRQCRDLDLSNFMDLDGNVQRGQRCKQGCGPVAAVSPRGEESIKERHGDGHHLSREIKVVDHIKGPMADFFAPRRVQRGNALVDGGT